MRLLAALGMALVLASPAAAQTPKPGGVINLMQREELAAGFANHEKPVTATSR